MTTADTAPAAPTGEAPTEGPQEASPATATATLRVVVLRRVLDGLVGFAARNSDIPLLAAIRLRTLPVGDLTAVATDRYRAGMVRIYNLDVQDREGTIDALIPRPAVEALLKWLPEPRSGDDDGDPGNLDLRATITQTGPRIEVKLLHPGSLAWLFDALDGSDYPAVEGIIRTHLDQPANLTEPIGLDGRLISDLDKFRWSHDDVIRLWASDPHGAVAVAVGKHFVGAVMAVRHGDDCCYKGGPHIPWTTYSESIWGPILGEPAARLGVEQEGADK